MKLILWIKISENILHMHVNILTSVRLFDMKFEFRFIPWGQ